jgi:hypothetical protein
LAHNNFIETKKTKKNKKYFSIESALSTNLNLVATRDDIFITFVTKNFYKIKTRGIFSQQPHCFSLKLV